ncbi:MAG: DivIVA domain-containing protein [Acidimicrobiia bacterium]|nr:DivIVA domain-containing protein [Acidimicrobiia bacterium]
MSTGFEDSPTFSTKLRGFDQGQVNSYIEGQAARISELAREKDALLARLEQMGETSIDFNSFADELRHILEAAHQAADTLRNRATSEVTAWRDSAHKEIELSRREAGEAAENLRRDAWIAAETLIEQSLDEAKHAVEEAAREALAIVGKAERDAHRIQSNARRESEELMRLARMESERLLVDARAQHDEIVEKARTQADAAQERARSLEVRRVELLSELDSVQVAVARLEDDLKRKREELEAAPPAAAYVDSSVKVIEKPSADSPGWDSDGIKLIPAPKRVDTPNAAPIDASEMAEEVRRLNAPRVPDEPEEAEFSIIKIIPAKHDEVEGTDVTAQDETGEDETAAKELEPGDDATATADEVDSGEQTVETPQVEAAAEETVQPAEPDPDDLGGLFAALRETAEILVVTAAVAESDVQEQVHDARQLDTDEEPTQVDRLVAATVEAPADALELRDHLLLPIMNRVLRDIKRQLTEAQNIALEHMRVAEDEWEPDVAELTERVHGGLTIVAQESFAAGYEAVEEMTGSNPGRPKSHKSDIPNVSVEFAEAIAADLVTAASKGDGPRAAASAVSRAYRAWRTDTAERRVRAIARAAYHRGIARALVSVEAPTMVWAVAGRGCIECRTMAEAGPVSPSRGFAGSVVPPLHNECSCTVVLDA